MTYSYNPSNCHMAITPPNVELPCSTTSHIEINKRIPTNCFMVPTPPTGTWPQPHQLLLDHRLTNCHMTTAPPIVTCLHSHQLSRGHSPTNCHMASAPPTVTWPLPHQLSHDHSPTNCQLPYPHQLSRGHSPFSTTHLSVDNASSTTAWLARSGSGNCKSQLVFVIPH